jgi:hypothetical protein
MSRIHVKNLPRLRLTDLLRRRKTALRSYLNEFGITTYEGLLARCERMGVAPPEREDFEKVVVVRVSSPPEGVVVLEAPKVIKESTGEVIDVDAEDAQHGEVVVLTEPGQIDGLLAVQSGALKGPTKKARKKKEGHQQGNANE